MTQPSPSPMPDVIYVTQYNPETIEKLRGDVFRQFELRLWDGQWSKQPLHPEIQQTEYVPKEPRTPGSDAVGDVGVNYESPVKCAYCKRVNSRVCYKFHHEPPYANPATPEPVGLEDAISVALLVLNHVQKNEKKYEADHNTLTAINRLTAIQAALSQTKE